MMCRMDTNVKWEKEGIVVCDHVIINPPYTLSDVTEHPQSASTSGPSGPNMHRIESTMGLVRKLVLSPSFFLSYHFLISHRMEWIVCRWRNMLVTIKANRRPPSVGKKVWRPEEIWTTTLIPPPPPPPPPSRNHRTDLQPLRDQSSLALVAHDRLTPFFL